MSDKKQAVPVTGSHCGLRPDPDAENAGIDFSGASDLLKEADQTDQQNVPSRSAQSSAARSGSDENQKSPS